MCGIVGYVGRQQAAPILLEGLRRLEYRGYDSAGMSVLNGGDLQTRKKKGKIDEGLGQLLNARPAAGHLGIGHTRWATHGPPSDENSHPHLDQSGRIAVVQRCKAVTVMLRQVVVNLIDLVVGIVAGAFDMKQRRFSHGTASFFLLGARGAGSGQSQGADQR